MISQLSIEQTLDEVGKNIMKYALFGNKKEAQDWITDMLFKEQDNTILEIFNT